MPVVRARYWAAQENVEIVRRGWDAWARGDLPGAFREYDPEVVWDMSHYRDSPESEYRGTEAVERYFNDFLAILDDYEIGIDEILAAPDGRVVTLYWQRGRGRRSGLAVEAEVAHIATVRDGKITRIEIYSDHAEALEAAGLSE
jgi:ketosteroid isomerase-like protein